MTSEQNARYRYLIDRRLSLLLRSSIGLRHEYREELEEVNQEIGRLETVIGRGRERGAKHG